MAVTRKIFDRPEIPNRVNENLWFKLYQPMLLKMANTDFGRDLLCINKSLPRIIGISKRHVTADLGGGEKLSDFRVGAKWGNVIRYRWDQFQSYARYFVNDNYSVPLSALTRFSRAVMASTTTAFPDPDPESTTVDGNGTTTTSAVWATFRAAATASVFPSDVTGSFIELSASTTTNQWDRNYRSIFGFSTSAIPDTDTISGAVFSLWGTATQSAMSQSLVIDRMVPASATNLTTSDLELADWAGVEQAAARIAIGSFATGAYNNFTLNATGLGNISKTGVSWFGTRCSADFDNSEPTWGSNTTGYATGYFAEQTSTGNDPQLVVTHAASGPAASRRIIITC